MALVIVGWVLTACVLICQGIYILRTGHITFFFAKPKYSRQASGLSSRCTYALVYLLPGTAALAILAVVLARAGFTQVATWMIGNFGTLFWPICLIIIGILNLLRPEQILRQTLRSNPELADNSFVVLITRFIGVGFLFVGFTILATSKS